MRRALSEKRPAPEERFSVRSAERQPKVERKYTKSQRSGKLAISIVLVLFGQENGIVSGHLLHFDWFSTECNGNSNSRESI